jgi:hypothetical protein
MSQMKLLVAGMQGVASLSLERVSLHTMIGGFELAFWVEGHTVTPDPGYWAVAHGAEVQLGGNPGQLSRLGVARPSSPMRIRTAPSALAVGWEFRIPVTTNQLAQIEELRASGDLQIKIVVSGEGGPVAHADRVERIYEEFWRPVGRSDWVRELNSAKAMDILLFEVAIPFVNSPGRGGATIEALRTAQRLFVEGNYPESIARCRTAIEALAAAEGRDKDWSGPAFEKLKPRRGEMSKEDRELLLEASLLHFTHLGAHPNEVQIGRQDAKLAIALTASVLAYHSI